jgi:excisionase family DNA binding protein
LRITPKSPKTSARASKFSPLFGANGNQEGHMQTTTRFLNVGQAAEYLGVSAASLRTWSNRGLVATYRTPGGQRRYDQADLDAFMHSMREPVEVNGESGGNGGAHATNGESNGNGSSNGEREPVASGSRSRD